MSRLGVAASLTFALAAARAGALSPGSTLTESVPGAQDRDYTVKIPAGQVARLSVIEKQGMAGVLTLFAADDAAIAAIDLGRRTPAAKSIVVPSQAVRLHLQPANHSPVLRSFELRLGEAHAPTAADRLRLSAEQKLGEGERIERRQNPGYLEAALTAYQQSLAVWSAPPNREDEGPANELSVLQADTLLHIAFIQYQRGDMKPALETYQRARDLWSSLGDRAGMAAALQGMALVSGDTRDVKKAQEWGVQALEFRRALGDLRGQAETLFVLYAVALRAGHNDEARELCTQALALAQKAGDRAFEADADNFLGTVENELGNSTEARERYSAALAIDRDENEPIRAARALGNLAVVETNQGNLREAIADLEQLLPVRKALANPNPYATSLYNLAVNFADVGEFEKALAGYNEALAIFRRTGFNSGQGFVLRGLGNLYLAMGDPGKAESFFEQALVQWRASGEKRGEERALNSLGDLAARRGDLNKAADLHRQSLAISRAAGFQSEEARSLGFLAGVSLASGDARTAIEEASQQFQIAARVGDRDGQATSLQQQGMAWRRLGDTGRARQFFDQALALREASGLRVSEIDSLYELAALERDEGRLPEAAEFISRGLQLAEAAGASTASVESRMSFAASHRKAFGLAIDIAMRRGNPARAFELSERARARGLVDLIRQARLDIRAGVDLRLLARERRIAELLDARHERFTNLLATPHSAAQEKQARAGLDSLVDEYEQVEAEIRVQSPHYAALTQPRPLSLAGVQKLLGPSTALLEYWLADDRSYVWLVTSAGCQGFALPARGELETLARRAYESLTARNHDEYAALSRQLSAQLLGPLAPKLGKARRLWIVPDGALEYLPFAALPLPGSSAPLVEWYEVIRLPSASVLAEMRAQTARRRPAPRTVAVFADPAFAQEDSGLPRLPFSREEADTIAALAPGVWKALDADASRVQVEKPQLADYRIVHFATHAVLDNTHPELSGIALADGFLHLHDIYNLKLGADLVVLSACRTALGQEVRSEGLIGLTRGFMYAGVPQIMATLWDVRDRSTAVFMRLFYEAVLQRHEPPQAALRSAQLAMREDPRWSDPYYWAPFVMVGQTAMASAEH